MINHLQCKNCVVTQLLGFRRRVTRFGKYDQNILHPQYLTSIHLQHSFEKFLEAPLR